MPFVKCLPDDALIVHAFGLVPERARHAIPFIENLMRGPSPLTVAERELIGAFVSGINSCSYCYGTHSATAREFGIDENVLTGLLEDIETAPVDDKLKPILSYVKKLTLTPHRMVQADADAILDAGWEEQALVDAVMVCAQFNFFNRFVDGLGLSLTEDRAKGAGKRLHDLGYNSVLAMLGID